MGKGLLAATQNTYFCRPMAQKKLHRFAAIKQFANVLEKPENTKGTWQGFFNNTHPLVLELACGKGEYAIGLAKLYPEKNLIGIDIKGNRIWVGAKHALAANLQNVAFLRTQIEMITDYFNKGEVEEIWITFPDPQLRESKVKKRLTHPRFLRLYQQILKDGAVNLKTDSPQLYHFTKEVIALFNLTVLADLDDVHNTPGISNELRITTHYEKLDIAQSNKIHYLKFLVDKPLPLERDEQLKKFTDE